MKKTKIHYINAETWKIKPKQFEPFLKRLHNYIKCWKGIINVVFVNDAYIHALNKNYREKDKPTDILSFNYFDEDPKNENETIGEIYISIDTAKRQAKEAGEIFEDELNKLFVHGFLHLHGYDHILDEDYKAMYEIECRVLKRKLPFIQGD